MASTAIDVLIEGGKATAAPPLGPALGPMGVNIGQVVGDINTKTANFKGMQVPVKVTIDSDTKEYEITVGTPPASALIKKEAELKSGSGIPHKEFVGELKIEQIIKIAKMKEDDLAGSDLKNKIKEIAGTCNSMGIKVEELKAIDAIVKINNGEYDKEIKEEKTEISEEEKKQLEEERKRLREEIEKNRAQLEKQAKTVFEENKDKPIEEIRKIMADADLPDAIINKIAPRPGEKKK